MNNIMRRDSLMHYRLDFSSIMLILSLFILMQPYYFWQNEFIYKIIALICLSFSISSSLMRGGLRYNLFIVIFVIMLFAYIAMPGKEGIGTYPLLNVVGIIAIILMPDNKYFYVFEKLFSAIAILLLPSLIIYFLLIVGIDISYKEMFIGYKADYGVFYRLYPGAVFLDHVIYSFKGITIPRLCGIFDEPGLLGTISALYLCVKKLKINKKTNFVFLISGILSLSLAFYVIISCYFIAIAIRTLQGRFMVLTFCSLAFIAIVFFVPSSFYDFPLISRVYYGFFGSGVIDNRTNASFDIAYNSFLSNGNDLFFGMGNAAHTKIYGGDSSSIKSILYNYGIVGSFLIVVMYILLCNKAKCFSGKYNYGELYVFVLMYVISSYQRPDILTPTYISIFVFALIYYRTPRKNITIKPNKNKNVFNIIMELKNAR